jgi:hypothetical protein
LRAEFGESRYDREGQCLSKKTNGWLEPGLQATTIGSQIIYHAIALRFDVVPRANFFTRAFTCCGRDKDREENILTWNAFNEAVQSPVGVSVLQACNATSLDNEEVATRMREGKSLKPEHCSLISGQVRRMFRESGEGCLEPKGAPSSRHSPKDVSFLLLKIDVHKAGRRERFSPDRLAQDLRSIPGVEDDMIYDTVKGVVEEIRSQGLDEISSDDIRLIVQQTLSGM